jgi:hypothetical protein
MSTTSLKRVPALLAFCLAAGLALLLTACGDPTPPAPPSHLAMIAVSGDQADTSAASAKSLDVPVWGRGSIDSGPPTEFTFTLKRILLEGTFDGGGVVQEIWSSTEGVQITVSGSGDVDLGGVSDISNLPVGTVTGVKLTVAAEASITGELVNASFYDPDTAGVMTIEHLYTKTAYAYNSLDKTGGGALADFQTGPAEPVAVYWNGGDNLVDQEIEFPVSYTLAAGDEPKLTILVDVSRALRFYDGLDTLSGPTPSDLKDSAYFFSHSVLTNAIACFFGDAGSIQGYQTVFDVTAGVAEAVDIPGWLTLVYGSSGDILSGILIGDDDNALTVAKGMVQSPVTVSTGSYTFSYDISGVDVTGFTKVTALDGFDDVDWQQQSSMSTDFGGTARFTLKLEL